MTRYDRGWSTQCVWFFLILKHVCVRVSVSNRDRMNGTAIEHSSFSSSVFKINIRLECWLLGRCSLGSFITSVGGLGEDFYYIYILYIYTCVFGCVWMDANESVKMISKRERKLNKIKSIWYKVKTMYIYVTCETKGNSSYDRNRIKDNKTVYRSEWFFAENTRCVRIVHVFQ